MAETDLTPIFQSFRIHLEENLLSSRRSIKNMPKETFDNLPEEKKGRILEVAITEFADNAYEAASISKIVRKAGIAKGSFYQYFEDKKDLYIYLVELGTQEKLKSLSELPSPDPNSQLFGYLRWQFLSAVYFEIRKPGLARIAYRAFVEEMPFPEMIEELRRRGTTQFFKQLIAQGLLHGDVAYWIDPKMASFVLEAVYYQLGKYLINRLNLTQDNFRSEQIYNNKEIQQLLDNLMDILEAGMKQDPDQRLKFLTRGIKR
jgi:AcrR family transcriptional regulator